MGALSWTDGGGSPGWRLSTVTSGWPAVTVSPSCTVMPVIRPGMRLLKTEWRLGISTISPRAKAVSSNSDSEASSVSMPRVFMAASSSRMMVVEAEGSSARTAASRTDKMMV